MPVYDFRCPSCDHAELLLVCLGCGTSRAVPSIQRFEGKPAREWFGQRREMCTDCLQLLLEFEKPVQETLDVVPVTSLPAQARAGTPLTHDRSKKVQLHFVDQVAGDTIHGSMDLENGFYQAAGQLSDFHFRKFDYFTMPWEIWEQLTTKYDSQLRYIEIYDRQLDQAHRIDWMVAKTKVKQYDQGIGPRAGFPRTLFSTTDERSESAVA